MERWRYDATQARPWMEHLRIAWQGVAGRIPTVAEWERNTVGLTLREAVIRDLITYPFLISGFLVVYSFLPGLSPQVLGVSLAFGAGGFLYLAYLSWHGHHGTLLPSLLIATTGTVLFLVFQVIAG